MLTTTHLAVTVLFCLILNLNRDEWFVALMFGVMIDADHIFAAPRYVSHNGWAALLHRSWDDGSGNPWKSLLHYPVGAFVVVPLSIGWRYFLPVLFWALHLELDYIQNATLYWSTPIEAAVMTSSCVGIVFILYRNWSDANPDGDSRQFLRAMGSGIGASWSAALSKVGCKVLGVGRDRVP
jgi:hypothetical protein